MKLIENKTLGTAGSSIEFTRIPQNFTDLYALISIRSSRSADADTGLARFNGTSTGYSGREMFGSGSSVLTNATSSEGIAFVVSSANTTSNTFSNGYLYVPNYTGATNKSVSLDWVNENNATLAYGGIGAQLWSNTAAITTLTFIATNGNLIAGSTVSLYKITKGSDGIVTTS